MISNITLSGSMYRCVHWVSERVQSMSEQVARLLFEQPNKCEVARPSKSRAEASEYVDCCTSTIDVAQTIGPTHF